MGKVFVDITTSLDGFVAGPNPTLEHGLGEDGERIHEWLYDLESFKRLHGQEGGDRTPDSEVLDEAFASTGATIMGRGMYSGNFGPGPWEDDPNADGWWGDDPPFKVPVFVLTSHPRETVQKEGGTSFTFVTEGIESALAQAKEAAGDKNISIAGGASTIQQYLEAGVVDELQIHFAPLLLGRGTRLFRDTGAQLPRLETIRVLESPAVTHVKYRVLN
jgi:dihydrofolate reductase